MENEVYTSEDAKRKISHEDGKDISKRSRKTKRIPKEMAKSEDKLESMLEVTENLTIEVQAEGKDKEIQIKIRK